MDEKKWEKMNGENGGKWTEKWGKNTTNGGKNMKIWEKHTKNEGKNMKKANQFHFETK